MSAIYWWLEKSVVILVHVTIPCSILFSAVSKCINTIRAIEWERKRDELKERKRANGFHTQNSIAQSDGAQKEMTKRKYQKSIHRIYTESAAQKRYNLSDDGNKLRLGRSFYRHTHSMYGRNVWNRRQNPMIDNEKIYISPRGLGIAERALYILPMPLVYFCWLQKPISPSHAYQCLEKHKSRTIKQSTTHHCLPITLYLHNHPNAHSSTEQATANVHIVFFLLLLLFFLESALLLLPLFFSHSPFCACSYNFATTTRERWVLCGNAAMCTLESLCVLCVELWIILLLCEIFNGPIAFTNSVTNFNSNISSSCTSVFVVTGSAVGVITFPLFFSIFFSSKFILFLCVTSLSWFVITAYCCTAQAFTLQ